MSKELGPAGYPGQHHQPGPSGTELRLGDHGVAQTVAQAAGTDPAEGAAQAAAGAVTGRFTRPAEIADLVLMLASDRTGSVTGSDFAIDGGLVQALNRPNDYRNVGGGFGLLFRSRPPVLLAGT